MSALESLAPDQRAVLALVLQQGRSYQEIAALLGMPADAVSSRARAGLAALARKDGLPGEVTGPLADYLLGQQAPADADATRGLLRDSAPARAWGTDLAAQLAQIAPHGLPGIPEPPQAGASAAAPARAATPLPAAAAAAAARSHAAPAGGSSAPASSKLGGALLIAGVLAVLAVVLYLVLGGGGEDAADEPVAATPAPASTASPAPTATAQVADTIALRSTTGADAKGTMTVFLQDGQLLFALEARAVPPSGAGSAYGVWLTGPGDRARRLGFTNPVGADGQLAIQGPGENDLARFPKLYATYARVIVSRETTEESRRPGAVILSGRLPTGRSRG